MQRKLFQPEAEPEEAQVKSDELPIADCELCVVDSPVYELGRACCCVRLCMQESRLEVRRSYLDRWKRKNPALGGRVEREVKARWLKEKK